MRTRQCNSIQGYSRLIIGSSWFQIKISLPKIVLQNLVGHIVLVPTTPGLRIKNWWSVIGECSSLIISFKGSDVTASHLISFCTGQCKECAIGVKLWACSKKTFERSRNKPSFLFFIACFIFIPDYIVQKVYSLVGRTIVEKKDLHYTI